MIAFEVNDMRCGHCLGTITKALQSTDAEAQVVIDLVRRLVMVEPVQADAQRLREAIANAGYSPVAVAATKPGVPAPAASCCVDTAAEGPGTGPGTRPDTRRQ